MRHSVHAVSTIAALLAVTALAAPAGAQQHQHGAKPDSAARKEMQHDMKGMKGMNHEMSGHMASAWKEMDAFHAVLGGTFHPAADKGDLAPLKANAMTLADKAKAWAGSAAPASCATDDNRKHVATVASASADLAAKVQSGAGDAELKAAITAIHDTFEKVEKSCGGMQGMKH